MVFGFGKKKKKVKASVQAVGPATTRKATPKEMEKHRATIARDKPKGETVTAREADRRSRDRRKTATKETVLPTITAKAPIKAEPEKKRGFLETLVKGPKLPEGQQLKTGTIPIGPGGAKGLIEKFPALGITINTKTIGLTASLIKKVGGATGVVAIIGSYPFAGFIKEEALQTLSFGVRSATAAGDIEGAELALAAQEEVLNPGVWEKIIGTVPFVNIVKQLKDFYEAARIKLEIDRRIVDDIKIQQETGETEDEKWTRIREEEAEQDRSAVDYYNEQRKIMVQWEREAEKAARNEDAKFWRKERAKQAKMEAEDRKAIADFWIAYRKEALKIANDNRPSNLNFGLL